jgi:hypothetical protein
MSRRRAKRRGWFQRHLALAPVISLVTLVTAGSPAISQRPHSITKQQSNFAPQELKHEKCEERSFWARTVCDPVAGFTAALALFSGLLTVVSFVQIRFLVRADVNARRALIEARRTSGRQYRQMQGSLTQTGLQAQAALEQARAANTANEILRDEFVSTHRPKIILREAFTGTFLDGEKIGVILHLANIGETSGTIEASIVDVRGVHLEAPSLLMHPTLRDVNEIGRITLRGGASILIDCAKLQKRPHSAGLPVWSGIYHDVTEAEDLDLVVHRRTSAIHLFGLLRYFDENETRRHTAFHRILKHEVQRFYRDITEPDLDYAD